jgi:hypothetical protein
MHKPNRTAELKLLMIMLTLSQTPAYTALLSY